MYDLLDFSLTYREAIDEIAEERGMGLREYKLEDEDWVIVEQLRDILKARIITIENGFQLHVVHYRYSKMQPFTFRVPLQTSQAFYPPWTASSRDSNRMPTTAHILDLFRQQSLWAKTF